MKIAYNPTGGSALSKSQIDSLKNDIIFDLSGMAVYARGIPVGKVYLPFEKSTSSTTEGYNGLVPFPDYNGNSKTRFLREDGTWVVPTNTNNYRPISINGTPILENNNTALNLVAGTNITLNPKKDSNNKYTGEVTITASNPAWDNITGKPTTLAGYGITDAVKIATKSANVSESCVGYTTSDHNLQNGGLFTGLGADGLYGSQLLGNYVGTGLYYRGKINGTWTDWKTIAFTDSNVASATKLKTARKIWGQNFNGTADVSGKMKNVTSIENAGGLSMLSNGLSFEPENAGSLKGALIIGGSVDYGLAIWGDGSGKSYLQSGRTDGTNTAYNLILQHLGGNVGIGTTSPTAKLHVNGDSIINGKLTATSLAVNSTTMVTNLNADMVDGYNGSVLFTCETGYGIDVNAPHPNKESGTLLYKISSNCANIPPNCTDGVLVHFNRPDTDTAFQLASNYSNTGLYYRSGNFDENATMYLYNRAWKTIAFTDSNITGNAASATKLETSRTIWGLSFDGTKNVQGALSGATTITTSGNITTGNSTTTSSLSHTVENNNGKIGIYAATRRGLYDYTIGNWLIGTDGTNTRLMIGNIGIGTDSPLYKLHVAGTTSTNLLFIGGSSHPMIIGNGSLLSLGAANSNSKASVVLDLNTDSFRRNSASTAISLGTAAYPWANIYGDTITIKNYKNFINGNISYPNVDDSYKMGTDLGLISFIGDNGNDTGLGITWSFNTTSAHAGIYTKLSGTYGSKMYFATTNAFSHGPKAALEIDHEGNIKALRGEFKGNLTGNAGSVKGSYTSNGGQQNPNYFGVNKVGFLMMNTTVNNNSNCKDWIIMDCYSGSDVGGAVAFGVNRQSLGAYIMRSASERTSWTESAELLGTHNYNNYALSLSGGTLSGDLTLLNLYVNYMITSSKPSGALYNPWSIHMDNYLWIQSATANGTNAKGKIALSGKGAESLTELFLKADLTKIHNTILFNKLSVPTTSGGSTYGPGANGQVLKSNGSTVYWASDDNTTYTLPLAASGTRGGILIGYSESGKNYAVKLSSEKAYVYVPWTDTKVTLTNTTTNANYRVLLSNSANDNNTTEEARKSVHLTFNPQLLTLYTGTVEISGEIRTTTSGTHPKFRMWHDTTNNALYILSGVKDGSSTSGTIHLSGINATDLSNLYLDATTTYIAGETYISGGIAAINTNQLRLLPLSDANYLVSTNSDYNLPTNLFICANDVLNIPKILLKTDLLNVNGSIIASGEITAYSDRRLKSNIKPLENRGYIQPMTYIKDNKECIGFIAQDVLEKYPELVNDSGEYLSLNYLQYVAVLQALIIELEKRIKELENGTRKL